MTKAGALIDDVQEQTTQQLENELVVAITDAKILRVTDADTYTAAAVVVKRLKGAEKRIKEWFDPLVDAAHRPWKMLTARRKAALDALAPELTRLGREMVAYDQAQDRLRRLEEERLAEQARKDQEAEALRQAEQLERQGHTAQAAAVVEAAILAPAPAVVLESTTPKVQGIAFVDDWTFEVVNVGLLERKYLIPNLVKIGQIVKAEKGQTRIMGVKVWNRGGMRVRSA